MIKPPSLRGSLFKEISNCIESFYLIFIGGFYISLIFKNNQLTTGFLDAYNNYLTTGFLDAT